MLIALPRHVKYMHPKRWFNRSFLRPGQIIALFEGETRRKSLPNGVVKHVNVVERALKSETR